jgi:hypothetical protein
MSLKRRVLFYVLLFLAVAVVWLIYVYTRTNNINNHYENRNTCDSTGLYAGETTNSKGFPICQG